MYKMIWVRGPVDKKCVKWRDTSNMWQLMMSHKNRDDLISGEVNEDEDILFWTFCFIWIHATRALLFIKDIIKPFSLEHFIENHLTHETINSFYIQIFNLWSSLREGPTNPVEYLQIIWNNRFIQLCISPKSKRLAPISWPELYKAGIVKVKDLFSDEK